MKKMKMLGILTLTALVLSGCQAPSDREAALEDQVEQLEQQVTSLEQQQTEEVVLEAELENEEVAPSSSSSDFSEDNLDSLTTAVDDLVEKADKLVSGGASNQQDFFNLQGEFQEIENRLDYYEEQIEHELRQGNLSHDEARKIEFDLEKLEDKLDNAEERLEYAFGYDD